MRTLPLILASAVALCGCGEDDDATAADAGAPCDQPAFVTLDGVYDVFTYEASARPDGTGACSVAGATPRHTITWDDASAACAAEGWRLCTAAELRRACGGPQDNAFTWGSTFRGGVCNLREAYTLPDGDGRAGPAPSGAFPECVSAEGLHDLTGNLWEWVSDAPTSDPAGHIYQGAGWKTIAQMHHDENQACATQSTLVAAFAATYADDHVGFRCCRDAR